jgi:mRNA interferase MazF
MDDFDLWNARKKHIDAKDIGRNIGYEQNGPSPRFMRPTLVVKKFNNQLVWTLPLTSKQKSLDFYFNFIEPDGSKAAAILSQLMPASTKRMETMLYKMPKEIFLEIKRKLKNYL